MDDITASIESITKSILKNFNTLLDCTVRFSGEYNGHKIHYFIEFIEHYKRVKCIPDEQALQELQYLLQDQALNWWLRRKAVTSTWSEALTILENQYSKKRPAHVVYRDLFKHGYDDYISEEDFVDDKMELLSELPLPEMNEKLKLELIFALLPINIFNKINDLKICTRKDLKKCLKLIKLENDEVCTLSIQSAVAEKTLSQSNTNMESRNGSEKSSIKNQSSTNNTCFESNNNTNSKETMIKVRPTEDLMPLHVKEEEELLSKNFNFQIDSDIMTQINNIIDESEMNMNVSHQIPTTVTQQTEAPQQSLKQNTQPQQHQKENPLKATKRQKILCSYCRSYNHKAEVCFKKAKKMKLLNENTSIKQINPQENTVFSTESLPTIKLFNGNSTDITLLTESSSTTTTSAETIPLNSVATSAPALTAITSLSTKLIAPINGPTTSKFMPTKLCNMNTNPSPKCHQCGKIGFYKSICPNCSPIYNINNNTQYNK